jgi:hypothetical protein
MSWTHVPRHVHRRGSKRHPLADALQLRDPRLAGVDVDAQVLQRACAREYLAPTRLGTDPGGHVDGTTAVTLVVTDRVVGVEADPHLGCEAGGAAVRCQAALDGQRTPHRRRRILERDEEAVAGVVDLLAGVGGELRPQSRVVGDTRPTAGHTIGDAPREAAQRWELEVALVAPGDDGFRRTWSFAQLRDDAERAARALLQRFGRRSPPLDPTTRRDAEASREAPDDLQPDARARPRPPAHTWSDARALTEQGPPKGSLVLGPGAVVRVH